MGAAGQPQGHDMSGGLRKNWLIAAAALVLVVIAAAGLVITRPHPAAHTEGIAGRQSLATLDSTPVAMANGCLNSYRLQTAGRYGVGHQVYVLTFTLKSDPATVADLVSLLNQADCAKAIADTTKATRERLSTDKTYAGLAVLYRTSSGARLQIP
jgi:hypothetical protein